MPTVDEYDVIVVGFGAAGASAAIEAADRGARVLVLDRGWGGGATAYSGGIVYAGGGTDEQRAGGYRDTVENMRDYLAQEVRDAVRPETLARFCEQSPALIEWLKRQGVPFRGGAAPAYKTSYPTDRHYLYYSGNEKAYPFREHAEPAPRGHRVVAPGMRSGRELFERLRDSALAKGVRFAPLARVHDLIQDEDGTVTGVRYTVVDPRHRNARRHKLITKATGKLGTWMPGAVAGAVGYGERLLAEAAQPAEARARAVILAAGGFINNREWVRRYAPQFEKISPLGTVGDDGTGIRLGLQAGGTTDKMGKVTAWRFLSPPSAFLEGLTVGADGRRIASEDLYGATHGDVLMREFGGRGWAIYDAATWRKIRTQIREQTKMFQRLQIWYLLGPGHRKADTIEALAAKNGIDPAGLRKTVDEYNRALAAGEGDPAHKDPELCPRLERGPFYSIDISADSSMFYPIPGLTLGGLVVDEDTGEVLRAEGGVVPGLYAAGRTAVGVCSNGYISGLSIADCVFSGRRAGAHAAGR
ncbi:pyridine nucleotide-disulfide oxidoreductase family protein [Mycolicibacterium hassiacum DSM 44199]|uniref:Pyridine nucleotide-disulfide oxidoreductase family protein n=1 Tax=Mycolicibacterium hassiacum (strain DSM 44199 / CIP 105218 / JCM 12690 / 3849) TaxID=1122247 RepID=K5B8P1_MYCHD|nr:FAD-binding protein [Mycolicibacterium hassiacum]EKF24038.1 pyridine nucleotide-disulfide oxidoreductase family protein [Mycolicibacterium hassiacum DSM 44199]MBX5485366.1 FAD-binding protein [Mycolicibacterium hassiacum]MDA4086282.1 pyridine nucleotide-disulfide oxidoreductase [Mycolicibacterium hassiacum DSM 44199]VCT90767.1 3-oxo-5-alpha-steroid 4-dehydrogenase [Mycolicibacterium hassiacum DSM 44199]